MPGILYLVAVPIGNWGDITYRALKTLSECELILCEERREGERLLRRYGITGKPVEEMNEHNEDDVCSDILQRLREGQNVALISDAGTPLLADPGNMLVDKAVEEGVQIVPIPGPSSLLPALVLSGFPINEFVFHGFLSPKSDIRKRELEKLKYERRTVALLETPYRLTPLLADMAAVYRNERDVCIVFNVTMADEEVFRGTSVELYARFTNQKIKGEFVIVIGNEHKGTREVLGEMRSEY